ncbi:glycosyltransferase family 4 protein [Gemella cuniculi]|uniref:glycosyltransferase family 4 protein n=1 Tax=Gemella cuniculi TaxID=150240 RepID=UPI0004299C08|nr:glycosyltransferase family 4 protein [Gemella cuniculi]
MRKICLVKWSLNTTGGGEKVAISLANELSKTYHVHLVGGITKKEDIFYNLNKKIRYYNLFDEKIKLSINLYKVIRKMKAYFIKNDIDLVFGIGTSSNVILSLSTLGIKTKAVLCDHTNLMGDNNSKSQKVQRYIGSKLADKIITLTNQDREQYIKKYKLLNSKVNYIYNWIEQTNLQSIKYNSDSKKLITVGRFDNQKGYDFLGKVATQVLSKYPGWQWDIYGIGEESIKNKLVQELEKNNVLSQVNFMGTVKGTENIYPNHAIYVMTSRYEGLPLVLLEAKQYGLPIVSFKCPTGPSEIVLDKENGYLIDNYDVDKMSEKIIKLIENKELRESFSNNSMKDTEKFDKDKILKQWIDLIEELVGENK